MSAKDTPLGEKPDWLSLKEEVCRKIDYVAAVWEKIDAPHEWKDKIRRDLLLPNLTLLAEFCAAIDEAEDADDFVCSQCAQSWTRACSSCAELTCDTHDCGCDREIDDVTAWTKGSGSGPDPATAGSGERMTPAVVPGLAGGSGAAPNVLSSCFLHGEYTGSIFCPTCEREADRG